MKTTAASYCTCFEVFFALCYCSLASTEARVTDVYIVMASVSARFTFIIVLSSSNAFILTSTGGSFQVVNATHLSIAQYRESGERNNATD